jgi:hypothetical protein
MNPTMQYQFSGPFPIHVLAVGSGIDPTPLVNLLNTFTIFMTVLTFALGAPVFAKAGLQWAGGGGLLGDEHSVRGAVSSMKAFIVGAVICGLAALISAVVANVIKSAGGCTGSNCPTPTPGGIFPTNLALLDLAHQTVHHLLPFVN